MHFYRESEHAITNNVSSPPSCSSRRGRSLLKRLSWCGLISMTSRTSVAEKESNAFSKLTSYVTIHDVTAAIAKPRYPHSYQRPRFSRRLAIVRLRDECQTIRAHPRHRLGRRHDWVPLHPAPGRRRIDDALEGHKTSCCSAAVAQRSVATVDESLDGTGAGSRDGNPPGI